MAAAPQRAGGRACEVVLAEVVLAEVVLAEVVLAEVVLAEVVLAEVVLAGSLVAGGVAFASAGWSADGPTDGPANGIDAVVVDQGGAGGGSGVIPAQRGSEPGSPL